MTVPLPSDWRASTTVLVPDCIDWRIVNGPHVLADLLTEDQARDGAAELADDGEQVRVEPVYETAQLAEWITDEPDLDAPFGSATRLGHFVRLLHDATLAGIVAGPGLASILVAGAKPARAIRAWRAARIEIARRSRTPGCPDCGRDKGHPCCAVEAHPLGASPVAATVSGDG